MELGPSKLNFQTINPFTSYKLRYLKLIVQPLFFAEFALMN